MEKYILIHIPHSSLYIPRIYKKISLVSEEELEKENIFMCDNKIDELIDNKEQSLIFNYSRLYCDVERFRDDSEIMNKYGMGYIYTKTSTGKKIFDSPSLSHKKEIDLIYENHHKKLDDYVTRILNKYNKCIIIDMHSYSDHQVANLFNYQNTPDICLGTEEAYYNQELIDTIKEYFENYGYSVMLNYPYSGSIIPNKYFNKTNTNIVSIMIELNKKIYIDNFEEFKIIFNNLLEKLK